MRIEGFGSRTGGQNGGNRNAKNRNGCVNCRKTMSAASWNNPDYCRRQPITVTRTRRTSKSHNTLPRRRQIDLTLIKIKTKYVFR
ncbi:hypothetical protein QE152_g22121 [Popillia japonica]|uniref:Uncharacterized protein n=1 Tax=Popillia japonica TaxID=7064 RepID=A0AAW1KLZ5_POPJA